MNIPILVGSLAFAISALTASAVDFVIPITAEQEVPIPNVAGFTPQGEATVTVDTLTGVTTVTGSYSGMSSNVSASHIHGLAAPEATGGVLFGLTNTGGTSGSISGGGTLNAAQIDGLLDGLLYINIHTATNGAGEIRGQIVDPDVQQAEISIDPDQEVPLPNLGDAVPFGFARAVLDRSTGLVEISGDYSGMSSNVSASHLHGPADRGATAGVLFGLANTGSTSGTFSGSGTLTAANRDALLLGRTYINIHTANNGSGEIRGQVPGFRDPAIPFQVTSTTFDESLGGPTINITFPSAPGRAYDVIGTSDLVEFGDGEQILGAEGVTETSVSILSSEQRQFFIVSEQ